MSTTYRGGRNIAMKVPPHQWEATVAFSQETLGMRQLSADPGSVSFEFGANRLWIDRVQSVSRSEL